MKKTLSSHQSYFLFLTKFIAIFAMAFSSVAVQPASAQKSADEGAIWYVSTTGDNANTCTTIDSPCLTINGAIAKATDGDTIQVAIGTYTAASGNEVVLINKSITLSGGWNETFAIHGGISTIDGGGARGGITINTAITVIVDHFMIQNGRYGYGVGGIYNSSGILTINNSSISNNKGGGIYNYQGILALNNSTVSGNTSLGIYSSGITTLTNVTITANQSYGFYISGSNSTVQNTIIAGNPSSDCYGTITSLGYNLIGNTSNCSIFPVAGDQFNVDPRTGPLLVQTGIHPLAPTSPAIDAGNNDTCYGMTDQRGQLRVDGPDADSDITCDIGAYEYTTPDAPAAIYTISGQGQHTYPNTAFPQLLKARVLDSQGVPVENVEVLFTAPSDGASGNFADSDNSVLVLTDEFGIASTPVFTANGEFGEFVVNTSANGVTNAEEFMLRNSGSFVSPNGLDTNDCQFPSSPCLTINSAIVKTPIGETIRVAVGTYAASSGEEVVLINKSVTLSGGWDETFTTQNGASIIDGEVARRGITVNTATTATIDHFTITNGFHNYWGGGIKNTGTLTLNNSAVTGNKSGDGGGGISNENIMTINNTTISKNTTGYDYLSQGGGGILNWYSSTITINNSTISGNSILGHGTGGGIFSYYNSSVTLNNSTVSGNTGNSRAEGIYISGSVLTLVNSTIAKNQSYGFYNESSGQVTLRNSIIAENGAASDCVTTDEYLGKVTSQGYNLIGNKSGCVVRAITGDIFGTKDNPINANLGPLQNNGGATFTHALLGGSPALDSGNPSTPGSGGNACLETDQRGITRPKNGRCDIGAFEVDPDIPIVVSITRLDPNPTLAPSVSFLVTFSEPVTGVDLIEPFDDFTLTTNGLTNTSITSVSGSDSAYTVTVNTGAGSVNGSIRLNVVDNDSIQDATSEPLGGVGSGNGNFLIGEIYSLRRIPTGISPLGTISDATPTYKWNIIPSATKYQIQLWKGSKLLYTKTVSSTVCAAATCIATPVNILNNTIAPYKWRVRAMTNGVWNGFSAYQNFIVDAPYAGLWKGAGSPMEFYVSPSHDSVHHFSIYITVTGCGNYKITREALTPIKNDLFKFNGTFHADGKFYTSWSAGGSAGLSSYYIPGCGYVSGGPFRWSALSKAGADTSIFTTIPEPEVPFIATIDPEK